MTVRKDYAYYQSLLRSHPKLWDRGCAGRKVSRLIVRTKQRLYWAMYKYKV